MFTDSVTGMFRLFVRGTGASAVVITLRDQKQSPQSKQVSYVESIRSFARSATAIAPIACRLLTVHWKSEKEFTAPRFHAEQCATDVR
jgi:hypothetical protein